MKTLILNIAGAAFVVISMAVAFRCFTGDTATMFQDAWKYAAAFVALPVIIELLEYNIDKEDE